MADYGPKRCQFRWINSSKIAAVPAREAACDTAGFSRRTGGPGEPSHPDKELQSSKGAKALPDNLGNRWSRAIRMPL